MHNFNKNAHTFILNQIQFKKMSQLIIFLMILIRPTMAIWQLSNPFSQMVDYLIKHVMHLNETIRWPIVNIAMVQNGGKFLNDGLLKHEVLY